MKILTLNKQKTDAFEIDELYRMRNELNDFFNESIKIIKEFIKKFSEVNVNNLIELQMHYLLLWAAIERYCDLKYGNEKISDNIEEFSEEDIVIECINNLKNLNRYDSKTVFSAKDLKNYELNPKEPSDSLKFFYTIRCNVVHRGKILIYDDANLLLNSLIDLCEIFENVLKDTFKED